MNSLRLRFNTTDDDDDDDDDVIVSRNDSESSAAALWLVAVDFDATSFTTSSCSTLIGSPDDDVTT